MEKINKRQLNILYFLRKRKKTSNLDLKKHLEKEFGTISRSTIVRDINNLLNLGFIKRIGKGRAVWYEEKIADRILKYFDVQDYFKQTTDKRKIEFNRFNFEIFKNFKNIFNRDEINELRQLNIVYKQRIKKLPSSIIKREFERLTIELSWKSSQIEGNTYSLIDTEILIKENKPAKGHAKEEARMILNHKKTLDYILDKKSDFKNISVGKVEDIHKLLVHGLNISTGIRKRPIGVVGTRYGPLDNKFQIRQALDKTVNTINKLTNPFSKAITAILLISYIQPFEDGNKRTARLLSNAILLANNVCPLSFRSIEEADYKRAMVIFYEQNSARFFKELFVDQYRFAVENYFLA